MSKLRDAAQQALEALKKSHPYSNSDRDLDKHSEAIHALRTALAEQPAEQEPVAWCDQYEGHIDGLRHYSEGCAREIPLYTAPQPAKPAEQEPVSHIGWLVRDADGRLDLLTDLQIESSLSKYERLSKLYIAPQPAIPPGYKLVPEVPTTEWINNLARRQTGSFEKAPFAEIHQCIAELLESAPEAPKAHH